MVVFQLTVEDTTSETVQFPTMVLSLSPLIRFGTSTWTYEGCKARSDTTICPDQFVRECLGEYWQYEYNNEPLFRTMGNDGDILDAALTKWCNSWGHC